MNIEIVKATANDIPKVNELFTCLIQTEKNYDININEKFVINNFYEQVVDDLSRCLLIAKKDNEIIGYLYGFIIDDGTSVVNKVAKLDALFIAKKARRLNIATKLINNFKEWSLNNECRYIEVGVFNSNLAAYILYKNNNFIDIKTVMSLDLTDNKNKEVII